MTQFIRDTQLMFGRSLNMTLRTPIWIIIGLFQPVLYLLLFAPLLDNLGNVPGFPSGGAFNVFTPGLLVMMAMFSAAFVGFNLIDDIRSGVLERLRVTPVNRLALLIGMVLRDVITLLVQSVVVIVLSLFMGLRPDPLGLLIFAVLLTFIAVVLASCSYALAIFLRDEGSLASTLNTITVPLLLLSGITLPLTLAPQAIRTLAQFNPFSHAVDAARALFNGNFGDSSILLGFGLIIALMVLSLWWAVSAFRRETA
jgi:ABC-2 type transport system permease protein